MPAMQPGLMRHRVSVEQRTQTGVSDCGDPTYAWVSLGTRWAEVVPLGGGESVRGRYVQAIVSHSVRMRYWSQVTSECRLVHRSRYLNIVRVLNVDERNAMMELLCNEEP